MTKKNLRLDLCATRYFFVIIYRFDLIVIGYLYAIQRTVAYKRLYHLLFML